MTAPPPLSSASLPVAAAAMRGLAHRDRDTARMLRRQAAEFSPTVAAHEAAERLAVHMEARASLYERCADAADRCGRSDVPALTLQASP